MDDVRGTKHSLAIGVLACLPCLAQAQFPLDYRPHPAGDVEFSAGISCNMPGLSDRLCEHSQSSNPAGYTDTTPFYQERVSVEGSEYWHVIVGDPQAGFAQDVYIQMGGLPARLSGGTFTAAEGLGLSTSGGFAGAMDGSGTMESLIQCLGLAGGGCDPLRGDPVFTGNGSADPTTVAMAQTNTDAAMQLEFLKPQPGTKPDITQTVQDDELEQYFRAGMTDIAYDDMATTAALINTLRLLGATEAMQNAYFDASAQTGARPTAGRYVYIPAAGWAEGTEARPSYYDLYGFTSSDPASGEPSPLGTYTVFEPGTYLYFDGGFDHFEQDVQTLLNLDENPCGGDPFCP